MCFSNDLWLRMVQKWASSMGCGRKACSFSAWNFEITCFSCTLRHMHCITSMSPALVPDVLPRLLHIGLCREVSHKEWKKLFTATPESFRLTREFLLTKCKSSQKSVPVAEAILQRKRISVAKFMSVGVLIGLCIAQIQYHNIERIMYHHVCHVPRNAFSAFLTTRFW